MKEGRYDECAKCGGIITDHEVSVTLSSGKRICETCIMEAMKDKYGDEEVIENDEQP